MEFAYFRALRSRNGRKNVDAPHTRHGQRRYIPPRNRAVDNEIILNAEIACVKIRRRFPDAVQFPFHTKRSAVCLKEKHSTTRFR